MTDKTFKVTGLRIDIETRSAADIKFGPYVYSEHTTFRVLIVAYAPIRQYRTGATRLGAPRLLDLTDNAACLKFGAMLQDTRFQKHAFNANFERVSLSRWLGMETGTYLDPENWRCSAIKANANGVFGSLDEVARAVRSPIQKDPEGKRLIRLFSIPDRRTGTFTDPHEAPQDFGKYEDYCKQDVVTEAVVASALADIPDSVQAEYEADQRVNDRGIRHHAKIARAAVAAVAAEKDRVMGELAARTGLANPNSGQQMQGWLAAQDYPMTSLDKAHREEALADPLIPETVADVLTLKGMASLSSVAKHQAALDTRCSDGRIRGSLRFYGAHTGREAGRGIQPQNLPRYEAPMSDVARLLRGTAGTDAPMIAKGSVRGSLVPARDHVLVTFDYNAIEARTLGWVTGEEWVQDEFRIGQGKIYEATAATMFGVDKDRLVAALKSCGKCGKCAECSTRAKGKVSNLALGYAGGAGALVTMGAEKEGVDIGNYTELNAEWKALGMPGKFHEWDKDRHDYPELIRLRDLYRNASPMTVRFWKLCGAAWDNSSNGGSVRFGQNNVVAMMRDGRHNRLLLPSGRSIWYRFAQSHKNPDRVDRDGVPRVDRRTFIGKGKGVGHIRTDTHGGKLTENINQALARDVLFDLMMKVEALGKQGWPGKIILHVHDEVVIEVHRRHADQVFADMAGLMATPPDWAPGLVVKGEGDIMERYGK